MLSFSSATTLSQVARDDTKDVLDARTHCYLFGPHARVQLIITTKPTSDIFDRTKGL